MANSFNEWRGVGNLGKDPEIRTFQNGDKIANISIACTDKWKDRDGNEKSRIFWARIRVTGKKVDFIEKYIKKGNKLLVGGRLEERKWQDQNGQERSSIEIVCGDYEGIIQNLTPRTDGAQPAPQQQSQPRQQPKPQPQPSYDVLDDSVPF